MAYETSINMDAGMRDGAQGCLFSDGVRGMGSRPGAPPADGVLFDESETEDIVIARSSPERCATDRRRPGGAAANCRAGGDQRPIHPPMRIGYGKLVVQRLRWRPGDPFGQAAREYVNEFSWHRMVTSACVTAACGLAAVWLLHTIFA